MLFNKIFLNADGGSRGNPGPSAIGIVLWNEDWNQLEVYKEFIGEATNNIAEYRALVKALELASKYTHGEVNVFMDSELVINQMNGVYQVHKDHLVGLFNKVKEKEKSFEKVFYHHVRRSNKHQSKADSLVNEVLDKLHKQ